MRSGLLLENHMDPHGVVLHGLLEESLRHGATDTREREEDQKIFQHSLLVPLQHGEDTGDLLRSHPSETELHLLQILYGPNQNLRRN